MVQYFATSSVVVRLALRSVMLPAIKYASIHATVVSVEQAGFEYKEDAFLVTTIPMGLLVATASVMQLGASSPEEALLMQALGEIGSPNISNHCRCRHHHHLFQLITTTWLTATPFITARITCAYARAYTQQSLPLAWTLTTPLKRLSPCTYQPWWASYLSTIPT